MKDIAFAGSFVRKLKIAENEIIVFARQFHSINRFVGEVKNVAGIYGKLPRIIENIGAAAA